MAIRVRFPCALLLLILAPGARAEISVKAAFDGALVRPEALAVFRVTVIEQLHLEGEDARAAMLDEEAFEEMWAGVPRFENAAWISGPFVDESTSGEVRDGRSELRRVTLLRWTVLPAGVGELRAGAVALRVREERFVTEPASIMVDAGGRGAMSRAGYEIRLLGMVDRVKARVGEGITLATWLLCNGEVREVLADPAVEIPGFRVEELPLPVPAPERELVHEGRLFRARMHAASVLYPLSPGFAAIPARRFVVRTDDGSRWSMPLDVAAATEEIRIEVSALPEEGRPADFTGAVGSFTLDAALQEGADGAVSLSVTARGRGDLRSVGLPAPSLPPWVRAWGPRVDASVAFEGEAPLSRKSFVWDLRPERSGRLEIDDLHLVVFDPALERYVELRAPPVARALAAPAGMAGPRGTVAGAAGSLRPLKERPRAPRSWAPGAVALLVAGNILLGVRRRLGKGREDPRHDGATLRRARRDLAAAAALPEGHDLVARALLGFVAARTGRGALTAGDAVAELRAARVDAALVEEFRALLEACDAARFSGEARPLAGRASSLEAAALVERLAATLRSRRSAP